MYRALLEATAFGTRMIVETFVNSGVPVTELVVAGGLLKNHLLMQIYADAVGLPLSTVPSAQAPALGAAIHAATAAGAFSDVRAAAKQMGRRNRNAYTPIPENVAAYDQLYREYVAAYDWFGRGNEMMRRLRRIGSREADWSHAMTITSDVDQRHRQAAQEVCDLHAQLTHYELVIWTAGNVSARVPDRDLMVIKPSGVDYDSMTAEDMVVCDLYGNLVDGAPRPVVGHRRPRLRVPAHARGRWRRAHPLHLRHRVGRPRRADTVRADDDRRRVRR